MSCQLGPLVAGGQTVVTLGVEVPAAPGVLSNTAFVIGTSADPDPINNVATATTTVLGSEVLATTAGGWDTHLAGQPAGDAPGQRGLVVGTELPRTGNRSVDRQIITALALIAAGLMALFATRRRRASRA